VTVTRDWQHADILRAELLGPKRNQTLTLDEVRDAGRVFFNDPEGLAYYGMPPSRWFARGIRILGRTCTEATPDITATPIARAVAKTVGRPAGVADLFAGSANLMLHIARALDAPARGIEADAQVHAHTEANLALLAFEDIEVRKGDWESYFDDPLDAPTTVYVVSPPWGEAFSFAKGLDLARTCPPVPHILDAIAARDTAPACFAVIQHTPVEPVFHLPPLPVAGRSDGCVIVRIR
jgi:23S rRNA G2445 N2-methylase RlmL